VFRIRTETHGGAWCPKEHVSRDAHEYLEIDLGQLKVITLVETQGRFGNGQVRASIIDRQNVFYHYSVKWSKKVLCSC